MNYDITIGKGYYGTKISVAVYPSINRSVFRDTTFCKPFIN